MTNPSEPYLRAKAIQHTLGAAHAIQLGSTIEFLNGAHATAFLNHLGLANGTVLSVAGRSGAVVLAIADVTGLNEALDAKAAAADLAALAASLGTASTIHLDAEHRFVTDVQIATWDAGVPGPQGMQGDSGAPGPTMNWRGEWDYYTAYAQFDAVSSEGSSWLCTSANSYNPPNSTPSYWALISQKGGVGEGGPQGPEGPQGPQGNPGSPGPTINWRGEWEYYAGYSQFDAVSSEGSSWLCISGNSYNQPSGNPGYWALIAQKGSGGDIGPQGSQGESGPPGPTMNWRGEWDYYTGYSQFDAVSSEGSSWLCISGNAYNQPSSNPSYWALISQRGSTGESGSQGPQGVPGAASHQYITNNSGGEEITAPIAFIAAVTDSSRGNLPTPSFEGQQIVVFWNAPDPLNVWVHDNGGSALFTSPSASHGMETFSVQSAAWIRL